MVRAFKEKNAKWDIYLRQIAGVIRSEYTPNMLMLGREAMQPIESKIRIIKNDNINPAEVWVKSWDHHG